MKLCPVFFPVQETYTHPVENVLEQSDLNLFLCVSEVIVSPCVVSFISGMLKTFI